MLTSSDNNNNVPISMVRTYASDVSTKLGGGNNEPIKLNYRWLFHRMCMCGIIISPAVGAERQVSAGMT